MSISLCIITKNEEKRLENCLNNVKNIADEIIIADTGSEDRTKEIAKKFTDKVYDFEWKDDFSEARNFSIKKATKEWILVLDPDETISNKDLMKIKKLTKEDKEIMGYSFIQRTYSNTRGKLKWNYSKNDFYNESKPFLGWTYKGITRLFRNDKRIRFIYPIHETVIESIKNINGKIKQTNMPIHHFEILKGKNFIDKKSKYYIKLLKNKTKLYPKAKFYFELVLELKNLNKHKEAKKYFNKSIELNPYYKKLT
ncbi:hypothetical protein CMO94_01970 [Candidatus Woesearchaeota archaeon]|jgi:glycosyltransferase involved in cell wall biosynthesis|nr:hypothetical protein [Candidatus Woesearchaeota archaeon]|tara:strand:- start:707 stop:1468 length:762 start_codon:yes stop_codon:yes gene_type:complete